MSDEPPNARSGGVGVLDAVQTGFAGRACGVFQSGFAGGVCGVFQPGSAGIVCDVFQPGFASGAYDVLQIGFAGGACDVLQIGFAGGTLRDSSLRAGGCALGGTGMPDIFGARRVGSFCDGPDDLWLAGDGSG
ncbi:MAG: hypothetical protein R3E12_02070 [Candidatus Eisenbacteria bacterium]